MGVDEYLQKYVDTFGEGFPMYQLGRTRSDDEIISIIQKCLIQNKSAYEFGFVTDDTDIEY